MTRVESQKTRQFLLTTGDPLDPNELPERVQLFNEEGNPLDIPRGSRRTLDPIVTAALAAAVDTGNLNTRLAGGGESGSLTLAPGFFLLKAVVNRRCRIRFYTSAAKRDADVARDRFTDPMNRGGVNAVPDHGCTSELLIMDASYTQEVTPPHLIYSGDGGATVYYRIDSYSTTAGTVSVTLTIKDVEQ